MKTLKQNTAEHSANNSGQASDSKQKSDKDNSKENKIESKINEVLDKNREDIVNNKSLLDKIKDKSQEKEKDRNKDDDKKVKNKEKDKEKDKDKDKDKDKEKEKESSKGREGLSEAQKIEQKEFISLTKEIKNIMKENPELRDLMSHLVIEIRPEGLLLQIIDQDKRSMFPSGSSSMHAYTRTLMATVAKVLGKAHNKITITGHTDATPYIDTHAYSNWELSVDRANASRRFLEENGINNERFQSVIGKEATEPYVKNDPRAAQNRRIGILLVRENPIKN